MKLKLECKTTEERKAAKQFLTWLCEQGEQDYWNWQENQDDAVTIISFDYGKKLEAGCTVRTRKDEEDPGDDECDGSVGDVT